MGDRNKIGIGVLDLEKLRLLSGGRSSDSDESRSGSRSSEGEEGSQHSEAEEAIQEEEPELPELAPLELIGVKSVLEEAVDKLSVLKNMLPGGEIEWPIGYKTLKDRFGESKTEKTRVFPQEHEKPILSSKFKIQRDRYLLETTFRNTILKLRENNSYTPLIKFLEENEKQTGDEENLGIEDETNMEEAKDLRVQITWGKLMNEVKLHEHQEKILNLKDTIHDAFVTSQMEFKYVDDWENSRDEMNLLRLNNVTGGFQEKIENLNTTEELENRAHSENKKYILTNQQELEKEIENWMEAYEREFDRRDRDILDLEIKRSKQKQQYADLLELLEQQRDEMDRWIAHKEETRRQEEHEALLNAMATKIQAWWRGVMVRRCLGRFRKLKKGKKDKKGKKGGKKKK